MKNYKMVISYDGARYFGWEYQTNRDTIQGKLQNVLSRMCAESVTVNGAGRTDAGVHAKAMVANARMNTELTPNQIRDYMNCFLPDDIAIQEVKEAAENFHARYNATGKRYCYTCYDGIVKPVFRRKYVTVLQARVNVDAMKIAAKYLIGEHDYKSFCGNTHIKKSTVRTVDQIDIQRKKDYVYLSFHGNGFLQNMVRILVGTLLEVGFGRLQPEQIAAVLDAKDRKLAGPTAPPEGLCLESVDYK